MKSGNNPLSRKNDIVIQEFQNEFLIYDLTKNKAFCLNETSSMVWQQCDGTKSVAEISQTLSKDTNSNISEELVWLALNQFKKDNLLAESTDFITPFDGLNRREIVKRIGFASIVALPVIASVVAPSAINAQSGNNCGPIGACDGSGGLCTCVPAMQPGGNVNPDGCACLTNGDCIGNCLCGNPCTAPGGANPCQTGTCITDQTQSNFGSCSGVCPPSSFNFYVGGLQTPFCTEPFDNNSNQSAPCCTCNTDGDCTGNCSNNNAPGTTGVCVP